MLLVLIVLYAWVRSSQDHSWCARLTSFCCVLSVSHPLCITAHHNLLTREICPRQLTDLSPQLPLSFWAIWSRALSLRIPTAVQWAMVIVGSYPFLPDDMVRSMVPACHASCLFTSCNSFKAVTVCQVTNNQFCNSGWLLAPCAGDKDHARRLLTFTACRVTMICIYRHHLRCVCVYYSR